MTFLFHTFMCMTAQTAPSSVQSPARANTVTESFHPLSDRSVPLWCHWDLLELISNTNRVKAGNTPWIGCQFLIGHTHTPFILTSVFPVGPNVHVFGLWEEGDGQNIYSHIENVIGVIIPLLLCYYTLLSMQIFDSYDSYEKHMEDDVSSSKYYAVYLSDRFYSIVHTGKNSPEQSLNQIKCIFDLFTSRSESCTSCSMRRTVTGLQTVVIKGNLHNHANFNDGANTVNSTVHGSTVRCLHHTVLAAPLLCNRRFQLSALTQLK